MFGVIADHLDRMRVDSLIVEKRKTIHSLQHGQEFYLKMLGYLLKYALPKELDCGAEEVIVITDTIPLQKKRKAIEKAIHQALASMLPKGMKYRILHHASRSHYNLQIADYCCWAVYRKWERGEISCHTRIKSAIRSEYDIFQNGKWYYYDNNDKK